MTNDDIQKKINSYQDTICFLSDKIQHLKSQLSYEHIEISDLEISGSTFIFLDKLKISTVQDLLNFSEEDLIKKAKTQGYPTASFKLKQIKRELKRLNIKWVHEF